MKSLAERHEDRAKRKAENSAELTGQTTNTAAAAIIAAQFAADLIDGLDETALEQFKSVMAEYDPSSARSISEDENGNSMAGIGVVNTKVVPAAAESGNGGGAGGWTTIPEAPDLGGSNLNGASLEAQGVMGAGSEPAAKESAPAAKTTKKAEGE